jgi:hypothetical protein
MDKVAYMDGYFCKIALEDTAEDRDKKKEKDKPGFFKRMQTSPATRTGSLISAVVPFGGNIYSYNKSKEKDSGVADTLLSTIGKPWLAGLAGGVSGLATKAALSPIGGSKLAAIAGVLTSLGVGAEVLYRMNKNRYNK